MPLHTMSLCTIRRDASKECVGGAGDVAGEAAGTVSLCLPRVRLPCRQLRSVWQANRYFVMARRWRELAHERAAALECNQAPQAIPSRKWPRCLIGVTHASWPPCAALECIWAWFSYRRLPRLAASAAGLVGPGMNTAPVAECRHVSRARTLVDLLSGTGEGRVAHWTGILLTCTCACLCRSFA